MSAETYHAEVVNRYNTATAEEFGSSEMTRGELDALKELAKKLGHSRWAIEDYIEAQGWPLPEEISGCAVGEAAAKLACVVAEHLVAMRGPDAARETVWSYTTKNQADRYVYGILRDTEKISPYPGRLEAWHAPEDREPGYVNQDVRYPPHIDATKIYGIAKPHRYWPAQLLRHLEALRLQKISTNGTPPEAFTVPWRHFQYVIGREPTVQDISAGIAIHVLETVKHQGLSDDQLAALLLEGYSPSGPVREHGRISSVGAIWGTILHRVETHPHLNTLTDQLSCGLIGKLDSLDYPRELLVRTPIISYCKT
ncbi:MAG: hypothetical protein NUV52_04265 [Candidatus Roizmanbacteria bacterium]|nr:hypothetical protein [Candidatus Roizmanbacteria bacterium]